MMIVSLLAIWAMVTAASLLQQQSGTVVLVAGLLAVGIVSWRSKRGDFYKAVAEEKTAEAAQLRQERDTLKRATDITPITDTLDKVIAALDRHSVLTEQVFDKVADMNGALRAHSEAMKALADRLIIDEASRALLSTAATRTEPLTRHPQEKGTTK